MLSLFIISICHELSENLELLLKFYEHGFFFRFLKPNLAIGSIGAQCDSEIQLVLGISGQLNCKP